MGLQARIDTKTTTYAYDAGNNRIYKGEMDSYQDNQTNGSSPELPTEYVYGSGVIENGHACNSNQLIYYGESGGPYRSFTYDANGNRRTATFNGNTDTYSWDFENRLLTLDLETGSASANGEYAYAYDYRSRRLSLAENNGSGATVTVLSFSGGTSVMEMSQDGSGNLSVQSEMIRGSDWGGGVGGLLYSLRSGQFAAKSYNSRGDVVSQTDSSGAVTWQAAYEAFGTRSQETDPADNPDRQRANTKEEDPTGLLNEGFRYRDLASGAFISRDPAGFVDGPNVYTYVIQNPWTKFDPLGLASEWHHDYPQEFEGEFKDMDIDIHEADKGVILDQDDHKKIHGKGKGVDYNKEWRGFFDGLNSYEAEHGELNKSERRARAEAFRNGLKSQPKYKQILLKGAPIPEGMHFKRDYSRLSKVEKAEMFRNVWGAAKQGRVVKYLGSAGKIGGKLFKVAGVAMIPSQFAQGRDYVEQVYSAESPLLQGIGGVGQVALPLGPADASATWDMSMEEVVAGNQGFGALGELFFNPASPRWLPTQILRGAYGTMVGSDYATGEEHR